MIINLVKDIVRGSIVGIIVFLIICMVDYNNGGQISLNRILWTKLILTQVYAIVLFIVNACFFRWLWARAKLKTQPNTLFLISSLGAVLLCYICLYILNFAVQLVLDITTIESYLMPLTVSFLVGLTFSAIQLYKTRQETKVEEQKFIAGAATAQFDALKNQLDPHFLFNSLNVLSSLIEENPQSAQKFTALLSKVYRYVLEQKSKELVSVEEELNFARTYMTLVRMRFENSIVFEVEGNINLEANVVPLSLQLLLENAIKHNQVTQDQPLRVKIFQEDDNLIITNNFNPKNVIKQSVGVGLDNIMKRYGLLTNRKVRVEKSDTLFRVSIPLLTRRIKMEHFQEIHLDNKRYSMAKKKVESIKEFYSNLLAFIVVTPFLIWIFYMSNSEFPWVVFPIAGWGIGVIMHGMEVYDYQPFLKEVANKEKRKKLKDFYANLTAYLLVIPFLAWINFVTYSEFLWVIFPIIGWGIGVGIHWMEASNYHPFLGKQWEEKKIKELLNKDQSKK